MRAQFGAHVGEIAIDGARFAFALGDGSIAWESGERLALHRGPVLRAAPHPRRGGIVSGGDDGRLVWSDGAVSQPLAEVAGRWIDALAVSPASGLIAFACGRQIRVLDPSDPAFGRTFENERGVADLAFDPKGRRLAAATYGGLALWYARIAEQKPVFFRWAGSHLGVVFSPDGRFVISAMQENALHGWRLADALDLRMGGYPAKIRSLAFIAEGKWLATSGGEALVLWPFAGASGPMGKQAVEIDFQVASGVRRLACRPDDTLVAVAFEDGRIGICDSVSGARRMVKTEAGPPISAIAIDARRRLAWGDERGGAEVLDLPHPHP